MLKKELKKSLLTIPFLLLALVTLIMYFSQLDDYLSPNKKITEPQPGQVYGMMPSEAPQLVMPKAISSLFSEFIRNDYKTYPVGFMRYVRLGHEDEKKMAAFLSELTGNSKEDILAQVDTDYNNDMVYTYEIDENGNAVPKKASSGTSIDISPTESLSYARFKEIMSQVDMILGGGSAYSEESLSSFGMRERTYEEALAEYEASKAIDGFTGGHARLFADYLTLFSAWLPAFFMTAQCLKDKGAKMRDLIWSRRASSLKIEASRYLAVVLLSIAPIAVLALIDTVRAIGLYAGQSPNPFSYIFYTLGWILPTVMFSAALAMFFTELTDTPAGLLIIIVFWFVDLNMNLFQISGGYSGLPLAPRHNNLMGAQTFSDNFGNLLTGRLFYLAMALALVAASALILEMKRKGRWKSYEYIKTYFRHRKDLPAT